MRFTDGIAYHEQLEPVSSVSNTGRTQYNTDMNQYGLSRDIPDDVKLAVRQRCGFGCVICGSSIFDYEHFYPSFAETQTHDPDGITLLCSTHHAQKTRGRLSLDTVRSENESPAAITHGFAHEALDLGTVWPIIHIGTLRAEETPILLEIFGEPIISITPSKDGGPFLLNAVFCDEQGQELARIVDNEWRGQAELFDTEITGARLRIRNAPRNISLEIALDPPHGLSIERLSMYYQGVHVQTRTGQSVEISTPGEVHLQINDSWAKQCQAFLCLGDGVAIGRGGGRVYIGSMRT